MPTDNDNFIGKWTRAIRDMPFRDGNRAAELDAQPRSAGEGECCRSVPCQHPGIGPCDMPARTHTPPTPAADVAMEDADLLAEVASWLPYDGDDNRIRERFDAFRRCLTAGAGNGVDGASLISAERRGQIEREGYDAGGDDEYIRGELVQAAIAYALWEYSEAEDRDGHMAVHWPRDWNRAGFKPRDEIANLVRAGALIAAEIDRLQRAALGNGGES